MKDKWRNYKQKIFVTQFVNSLFIQTLVWLQHLFLSYYTAQKGI